MRVHVFKITATDHAAWRRNAHVGVFRDDGLGPGIVFAAQEFRHGVPVERVHRLRRLVVAGDVQNSRREIEQRDGLGFATRTGAARIGEEQRHSHRPFVEALFEPHAALAQHFAVVGREDDDGVIGKAGLFERTHDAAHLGVDIAHHRVVGMARIADVLVRNFVAVATMRVIEPAAVGVEFIKSNGRHGRHIDVFMLIKVPEFARRGKRRMWVREGRSQEERLRLRAAGQVVQFLYGVVLDFVVVIDLQAALARPRFLDYAHADAAGHAGRPDGPIRCPRKISGVDVSDQALFIAV